MIIIVGRLPLGDHDVLWPIGECRVLPLEQHLLLETAKGGQQDLQFRFVQPDRLDVRSEADVDDSLRGRVHVLLQGL